MVITKPVELAEAEHILSLCERFHCLPSALMKESTALLRLLDIRASGAVLQSQPVISEGDDG